MPGPTCTDSTLLSKAGQCCDAHRAWAGWHSESPEAQLYLHPGFCVAKAVGLQNELKIQD